MGPISNTSAISTINQIQTNNASSEKNNDSVILESREKAIEYIKALTHNEIGEYFEPENTVGKLKNIETIPLRTIELANGDKQYYVTANMAPNKFEFYLDLDNGRKEPWSIYDLEIQNYHKSQVVFIFGAEINSDTLPVDMSFITSSIEKIDGVNYVYCNHNISFSFTRRKT
ncbi:hypothetical protein B4900_15860 [Yersinia rohdei]|nr:hypothetical protein B4900_15860 [Yersinia rohdei]